MHSCPSKLSLTVFLSRRRLLSLIATPRGHRMIYSTSECLCQLCDSHFSCQSTENLLLALLDIRFESHNFFKLKAFAKLPLISSPHSRIFPPRLPPTHPVFFTTSLLLFFLQHNSLPPSLRLPPAHQLFPPRPPPQ